MDHTAPAPNTAAFTYKPVDAVTGVLPPPAVDVCRRALRGAGIDAPSEVLLGPEGRAILTGEHAEHPVRAVLYRALQHAGTAGTALELYEGALARGAAVITVPVTGRAEAEVAAEVVRAAGGTSVQYFNGGSAVESL